MNKNQKIYLALIVIFLLAILLGIYLHRKNTDNNQDKQDKKDKKEFLPDNSILARDQTFYEKMRDDTLKYLVAVYPQGKDSLEKLSAIDLAKFYNSLWFYYNCESEFAKQKIMMPTLNNQTNTAYQEGIESCWEASPGCGSKYPKLPYTPQGFIYSFNNWLIDWTPWINSNSTLEPKNLTGSFPGQTFSNFYNGPSPVWMYQRAIFRNVYSGELPSIDYNADKSYPSLLPGNLGDFKSEWNYPINWWNCVPDNGYVEVTAASEPGMATSPPLLWIDGWYGSGLFFNVGKSFRSRNKASATFFLAKEMGKTTDGKNKLEEWFNSSDPYQIMKNLLMYNNIKKHPWANIKGPTISDSKGNKISNCNILYNAQSNPGYLPYLPTNQTIEGVASTQADYGFWGTDPIYNQNYYSWCDKAKEQKMTTIPNSCIDDIVQDRNYPAGRLANTTLFDESTFAMALWLKYDSVQLSMSANGSGFWQYEIMVLYDLPEEARERDYSSFMEIDPSSNVNGNKCPTSSLGSVGGVKYKEDFTRKYMANVGKYFSLRDPLDVDNDEKATNITFDADWDPKSEYNITVKNHISSMFTGKPIIGQPNDQCS